MARRARRRRKPSPRGDVAKAMLAVLAGATGLAIIGAFLWGYETAPTPVKLNPESLCPTSGPRAEVVVLLDATDQLPVIAKEQVKNRLKELAESQVPKFGLLEFRVVDPSTEDRTLFSKCNPGDGKGADFITQNPALLRKRWLSGFMAPLETALEEGLKSDGATTSPIMAAIQKIAVERFDDPRPISRRLVVISDMIENTPAYSQYRGDLSYERFKRSADYKKLRTDLHGAEVTILYVQRTKANFDSAAHIKFWLEWIKDNNGQFRDAEKLQGAN